MQFLTITAAQLVPFVLPLRKSFSLDGQSFMDRQGYYLELKTAEGVSGQGEIAPLMGVSEEALPKAKHEADLFLPALVGHQVELDREAWMESHRRLAPLSGLPASVRFGVESATCSLAAQARAQSLAQFLGGAEQPVASAVLLQGNLEEILQEADRSVLQGARTFKLKVGDRNIPLEVKKVKELRKVIGLEGAIRLDANRKWKFEEAVLFAQLVGLEQIEFIEEPLASMDRLNEFYKASHMPVALDESLMVMRPGVTAPGRCSPTLAHHEAVKAYVIKPMIVGGVVRALDWIAQAKAFGKVPVVSSAFESPVGLKVLKALAQVAQATSGLGTERWWKS